MISPLRLSRILIKGEESEAVYNESKKKKKRKGFFSRLSKREKSPNNQAKVKKTIMMVFFIAIIYLSLGYMGYHFGMIMPDISVYFKLIMQGIAIFTAIFTIYNLTLILYYAEDLAFYLTLPLPESTLVTAKVIQASWVNAVQTFGFLGLPMLLGAGIGARAAWSYYLATIVVGLGVTLCSQAIFGMILVVAIRYTTFARNKDRFISVFSTIIILFVVGISLAPAIFNSGPVEMTEAEENAMIASRINSGQNNSVFAILSSLISPALFVVRSTKAWTNGRLNPLAYLLIIALTVALMYLLYRVMLRLYIPGAMGVQGSGVKSKGRLSHSKVQKGLQERSGFSAILHKDWLILKRTPTYFTQYLLSSALVPLIFAGIFLASFFINRNEPQFADMSLFFKSLDEAWQDPAMAPTMTRWIYIIWLGFLTFISSSNSISLSLISREGESAFLTKLIPQSYLTQMHAKLLLGSVVTYLCGAIIGIPLLVISKAPLHILLTLIVMYFAQAYLTQVLDGLMDLTWPNVQWSQETEIAKRKLGLFSSLLTLGIGVAKGFGIYYFSVGVTDNPIILTVLVLVVYFALLFFAEILLRTYGQRKFSELVV